MKEPKAGSKEDYLKRKLEVCYRHTPTSEFPNCYESYVAAKKEFSDYSREEKKRKKQEMEPIDKIHDLLSSASKFTKSSDKLNESGKIPQANGMRKKAEECLKEADQLFQQNTFTEEELQSLSEQETNALQTKSLEALKAPPTTSDSNSSSASSASSATATTAVVAAATEQLQKKVKTYKRYVNELTTEIEQALPYVEEPTHKRRLQKVIRKQRGRQPAAAVSTTAAEDDGDLDE
jgi:hypothetical protein